MDVDEALARADEIPGVTVSGTLAAEVRRLRGAVERASGVADEMPDIVHAAAHHAGATWGSVAEYAAEQVRRALDGEA